MKTALVILLASAVLLPTKPRGGDPTEIVKAGSLDVSREAVEHVIKFETGGRAYYERFYERPQDPGFASGVTVGFGYDLKFHTKDQIARDWQGAATPAEIAAMVSVAGLDGSAYRRIQHLVHIEWNDAQRVFEKVTLPRWGEITKKAYRLDSSNPVHPHLAGALLGNSFNRGPDIRNTNRLREKYERRELIAARRWSSIPATFIAEQRHWPNHDGLKRRRREEAALATKALDYTWWQR